MPRAKKHKTNPCPFYEEAIFPFLKMKRRAVLLLSFFILAGLIYLTVPLIAQIENNIVGWYFNQKAIALQEQIDQDATELLNQAQRIAKIATVKNLIIKKDSLNLLTVLSNEKQNHNLGLLLASDNNGAVLTRTVNIGQRGDNIFATTCWGSAVAQGRSIKSVENGPVVPFLIIAGSPVYQDQNNIGGVFVGQALNDNYATKLKATKLDPLSDIFFFSYKNGLTGTSLVNPQERQLLIRSFNAGKNWLNQDTETRIIKVDNNYFYFKNALLPGLNGSKGGVVLLSLFNFNLFFISISLFFCGIFFLIIYLIHHRFKKHWSARRHYIFWSITIISSALLFYFSYSACQQYLSKNVLNFDTPVTTIYNSSLRLEPEQNIFDRNFQQKIAVKIDSGGEAINSVHVVLNYNPKLVQATDIITNNSFCPEEMFLEKNIDNTKGVVTITCSAPSPGFSSTDGTVAELLLQPLVSGKFSLLFDPATQILANDGLGTNVLREVINGSYQVVTPPEQSDSAEPQQVVIFSPSHPNSERWYNKNNINLTWMPQDNASFSYLLDKNPQTTPYNAPKNFLTLQHTLNLSAESDGIYFFHISAFKNGVYGPTTHYQIKIDVTAPSLPTIKVSDANPTEDSIVRFEFAGEDATSGIQPNFYVKIDDSIWLPSSNHLETAFINTGDHEITVKTFDNAGNYSEASINIKVRHKQASFLEILPIKADY